MCQVGGPQVHRQQLLHLLNLAADSSNTIDLRVIPFEAGDSLAGLNAATFHLLDFQSARLPTVGWLETAIYGDSPKTHAKWTHCSTSTNKPG